MSVGTGTSPNAFPRNNGYDGPQLNARAHAGVLDLGPAADGGASETGPDGPGWGHLEVKSALLSTVWQHLFSSSQNV